MISAMIFSLKHEEAMRKSGVPTWNHSWDYESLYNDNKEGQCKNVSNLSVKFGESSDVMFQHPCGLSIHNRASQESVLVILFISKPHISTTFHIMKHLSWKNIQTNEWKNWEVSIQICGKKITLK